MPSGLRPIQSPENRVSPEEWEQRVNLAAAYRLMAANKESLVHE